VFCKRIANKKENKMTKKIEVLPGYHITHACEFALAEAKRLNEEVSFEFNGTEVIVSPSEQDVAAIETRWNRDMKAAHEKYINSAEYKAAEEKRAADLKAKMSASMKEGAKTEAEMREAKNVWPYTIEQLIEYITSLVDRQHDYGTCVYALSLAAVATFNYVSHQLGVTGFQASCADLDFLRRTRHIKGPFIVLRGEDALFPQYNLSEKLEKVLADWQPWLAEQAREKLLETSGVHPDVKAHWGKLASYSPIAK
jgi:hypothetical protein